MLFKVLAMDKRNGCTAQNQQLIIFQCELFNQSRYKLPAYGYKSSSWPMMNKYTYKLIGEWVASSGCYDRSEDKHCRFWMFKTNPIFKWPKIIFVCISFFHMDRSTLFQWLLSSTHKNKNTNNRFLCRKEFYWF